MKRILILVLMLWGTAQAQTVGQFRYDTTKFLKVNGRNHVMIPGIQRITDSAHKPLVMGPDSVIKVGTYWPGSGGGSGNTNSNIGAGYRWAVPNTNNIKTLFGTANLVIDSTTNANALTLTPNITGLVTAGTNVTVTGSGTSGSPYVVNSSGGIDSVYKARNSDSVLYFTGATPHYVTRVEKNFFATDYGLATTNTEAQNNAAYVACIADIYANGGGIMYIPQGLYLGQIILPAVSGADLIPIEIRGVSQPGSIFGTIGTFTFLNTTGTILKSLNTSGAIIRAEAAGGTFSQIYVVVRDLEVRSYDNPSIDGIDLGWALEQRIENVFVSTGVYTTQAADPTNGASGIVTPFFGNAAFTVIHNVTVSGYYNGIEVNEHTSGDNINIVACRNGLNFKAGFHGSNFTRVGFYRNPVNIYVAGVCRFNIDQMNIEHPDSATQTNPTNIWQISQLDLKDTATLSTGDITWAYTLGNVGVQHVFTKSTGAKVVTNEIGGVELTSTYNFTHNNKLDLSSLSGIPTVDFIFPGGSSVTSKGVYRTLQVSFLGTDDIFKQMIPKTTSGYTYLEGFEAVALAIGTGNDAGNSTAPILFRPNRTTQMTLSSAGALRAHAYTAGTATFDGSGNITSSSDRRIKNNIKDFKAGLAEVLRLRPRTFIYNADGSKTKMHGFIAQEVQEVIPGAVHAANDKQGTLSLETNAIIAALVNGMQEQQAQIKSLQSQIEELKKMILLLKK